MKITIDQAIAYGQDGFQTLGEVTALPTEQIQAKTIRDTELLIVRSTTNVNEALLKNTAVRFVGSATAGINHIDTDYLQKNGIAFAYSPGGNAMSVAEYVIAALFSLDQRGIISCDGLKLGVVGVGHVGSLVVQMAETLGMTVLQNDPPRAGKSESTVFSALDALMDCDVITLHVPLHLSGPYRTHQLFNESLLRMMKKGSVLINASRGEVVDESALLSCLRDGHLRGVVLDVWANEPKINLELLKSVTLATPHIAGYSLDGRVNGTTMVYQAACDFLGITPGWRPDLPFSNTPQIVLQAVSKDDRITAINEVIRQVYDIEADDLKLKMLLRVSEDERADYFKRMRKNYPLRREFSNYGIALENQSIMIKGTLSGLGFNVIVIL